MATVITDEGEEWISQRLVDGSRSDDLFVFAVGTGTTSPSESDTSMQSEVYRSDDGNSNCTIDVTSGTGEIVARISVSGGTEVPAGTDISEFGVFVSDGSTLTYHEVRSGVTVGSGEQKTFELTMTITG